ncbi:MAG: hypothetical protein ABSA30_08235 [Candidatus Aminicenantales bacterium]|jgi:hypothetical protein
MRNQRTVPVFKAALAVMAVLAGLACNPIENSTQSASLLTVVSITGLDYTGKAANFTQSDVLTTNSTTGLSTVNDDVATATLGASTLAPNPPAGTSQYNNIQLDKIVVSYTRTDGRNTQGVDVPYSFEQNLSTIITVGQQVSITFIIVRASAKQEPPLIGLRAGSSTRGEAIYTNARIDFYAHDLAGKNVTATGYLPVEFSDFANQ